MGFYYSLHRIFLLLYTSLPVNVGAFTQRYLMIYLRIKWLFNENIL